jgi:acyl-CoA hydrolase
MTEIILPNDTNTLGNLLGGRLMHFIDLTGAMAAYRHARSHIVTAAMDHIDFIRPVHIGDLLILKSSVNRAFTTSLEVGVKVWVEHPQNGSLLHVASAYLVFVSIDKEGNPLKIPQLQPETPDEERRYADAQRRREHRESEHKRRKSERRVTAALESEQALS